MGSPARRRVRASGVRGDGGHRTASRSLVVGGRRRGRRRRCRRSSASLVSWPVRARKTSSSEGFCTVTESMWICCSRSADEHVDGLVAALQGDVHPPGLRGEHRLLAEQPLRDAGGGRDVVGRDQLQLEGGAADRGLQLVGGALGDLHALVDDRDPVGELVGLVEVLRGEQDGAALLHQLADRGPHLAAGARVETGGRLVEEDQRGPGDQAGGQVEPATHAAGELGDLLGRPPPRARTARAVEPRSRGPRGGSRPWSRPKRIRFSVAVRFSSTEAYCPVTPRSWRTTWGCRRTSIAEDARVARVDRQQGGEHLEHGGLAGAVGSEDAEHLAAVHGRGRRRRRRAGRRRS